MTEPPSLDRLCELAGLRTRYVDGTGQHRQLDSAGQRRLLRAMGFPVENEAETEAAARALDHALHAAMLPPVVTCHNDEECIVGVVTPAGQSGELSWRIEPESGDPLEGRANLAAMPLQDEIRLGEEAYRRRGLALGRVLPSGYHRLSISTSSADGERSADATLIVAPRRCYRPKSLAGAGRRWGLAIQLYAQRSGRNWGMGDFTDLKALLRLSAGLGAAALGLNPLHALFPLQPEAASPYSPNSRLFLNILYLDIEAMPDFADSRPARRLVASEEFQERLALLRAAPLVDYAAVAACKLEVLAILFQSFRERCAQHPDDPRVTDFRRFQEEGGETLRRFALFQALRAAAPPQVSGWRQWPEAWRDPASADLAEFARAHAEEIDYQQYLQWQAERQLGDAKLVAERLGMSIGLYQDLAVGAEAGGAEAWDWQDVLVPAVSVGAPPDPWSLDGQNWGLPPFHPIRLRQQGYRPFAELLRRNMRRGGAIRIDHILGFMRLFWIPEGASPAGGSYVAYPLQELLAVLALESQRSRCLVVGEDLGTIPEGLREALADRGVLSYRLLYFERDGAGNLQAPAQYPAEALVAVSTHDLPNLAAYWSDADVALRDQLGLWPSPHHREEHIALRQRDRPRLLGRLRENALLPSEDPPAEAPIEAVHRLLALTPCRLLMIQLQDVLGQLEQINVPGTTDQYPNWRHRPPASIEELTEDSRLASLAAWLRPSHGDGPLQTRKEGRSPGAPAAIPTASYRLQLNAGFTFDSVSRIAPYLAALGVSHVYASPWLKARAGSGHGYDIIDHNAFSAELGGADGFEHLASALRREGLGHILDFVPNHMGVGGSDNAWWLDVLEWGQRSACADHFDIDWEPANPRLAGKVLLPFLGDHYGRVLEAGALQPRFDVGTGRLDVWYGPHRFPIAPQDYAVLLREAGQLAEAGTEQANVLADLAAAFDDVFAHGQQAALGGRREEVRKLRLRLAEGALADPGLVALVTQCLARLAGRPGDPKSFEALHDLLERQNYRLAFWGVAADEVNYRRFFTINDLASVRMETPQLFEAAHALIGRLLAEGKLHGLRIDHVDGLLDPADYCRRLRAMSLAATGGAGPPYIVVEKILARHERLPEDWPIHGTTGYDFLNQVTGLLVDGRAASAMTRGYHRFIGREVDFDDLVYEAKMLVMTDVLGGELGVLAQSLDRISERHWLTRDYTMEGLRSALMTVIACYPVYRTYVTAAGASPADRRHIAWAIGQARKRWGRAGRGILDFLERVLVGELEPAEADGRRLDLLRFAMRVQQYTGPVMAKGLEDTALYRYHRLIALNEVGGDPRQFGLTLAAFHHLNQERAAHWPNAMLATATHDTKRGEDARARIGVLSEIPEEWRRRVLRWVGLNRRKKQTVDDRPTPGPNDEYLLYQTLIGAWPTGCNEAPAAEFVARIQAFMLKAVREARWRSSWANPNEEYERALQRFVAQILDPISGQLFLRDFLPFQALVARGGMLAGLAQLTLKLTSPGMPDLYQGSELWDLSLVDPDNRRPVDFEARIEALSALVDEERVVGADGGQSAAALREAWQDGRIKLHVIRLLLRLRGAMPALFAQGDYQPCSAEGPMAEHVCAFRRSHGEEGIVVAVARHLAGRLAADATLPEPAVWAGTILRLPVGATSLTDVLTGQSFDAANGTLLAGRLFSFLPVAVLAPPPGPPSETS